MTQLHTVAHALNQLLLPIQEPPTSAVGTPDVESPFYRALEKAHATLDNRHLSLDTRGDYLSHEVARWQETGRPTKFLRNLVASCLTVEPALGERLPGEYFAIHKKLQTEGHLSFEDASSLLGHSDMIARLLDEESMSCAQVASVLSARRNGFDYNWHQVQIVATGLGKTPQVDANAARQLLELDSESGVERFADADPETCLEVLTEVGRQLGYPKTLRDELRRFYPDRNSFQPQYSIILYGNLLITEFYDHPTATAAYEFNPRGGFFMHVQEKLFPSYSAKESAYLNNSKGAFAFDKNWAWARKASMREQALALADILAGLSYMSYPARRAFATWMRAWLLRIEEAYGESRVCVRRPSTDGVSRFFEQVSEGNSKTYGILEQRAVDCLGSALINVEGGQWFVHGRGDSVSASNTSKKKLGDVEFKSGSECRMWAFEAHGGTLVPFYVDIHAATFEDILPKRKVELSQHGEPGDWDIRVEFVAHNLNEMDKVARSSQVHGYNVRWTFVTFRDLWEFVKHQVPVEDLLQAFDEHVTKHVDSRWVSDAVKDTFNNFIGVPTGS